MTTEDLEVAMMSQLEDFEVLMRSIGEANDIYISGSSHESKLRKSVPKAHTEEYYLLIKKDFLQ